MLRGRVEKFLGPDVVLMWLHLAHSGLCGAALLGNCSVELVDNTRAIPRAARHHTPRRGDSIDRTITLHGPLDHAQRAKLAEIAEKTPVTKAVRAGTEIRTTIQQT